MWLTVIRKIWGCGRKRGGLKAPIGMCTFFLPPSPPFMSHFVCYMQEHSAALNPPHLLLLNVLVADFS